MRTEFAGVLAFDVILVSVVLKNYQIRHRADKTHLPDFLLEAQKKYNPVVTADIDLALKIAAQMALVHLLKTTGSDGTASPDSAAWSA